MTATQRRVIAFAAIATWFAINSVRSVGPLLSDLFDVGVTVAAGAGFGMFITGGLLAAALIPIARRVGSTLLILAGVAIAFRLAFPFLSESALIIAGIAGTTVALALVLHGARVAAAHAGGAGVGIATALGTAVAVIEQVVVRTHDAVWRHDALGWVLLILAVGALAVGAWWTRGDHLVRATRGWWAHGLVFSLILFALGNIAFVNSQAGVRMSWASLAVVTGLLAGAYLSSDLPGTRYEVRVALSVAAVPAVAIVMYAPGASAFVAMPVLAASAIVTMAIVMRAKEGPQTGFRSALTGATWGVLALLPFMLIQLDYDVPLGFPHLLTMVAAIAMVAVVAVIRTNSVAASLVRGARGPASVVVAGVLVVALPVAIATSVRFESPRDYPADFIATPTVMSWNVHYGVTPGMSGGPDINLVQLKDTIASVNPDVLMLQEVNRGWILAGGVDVLEYLAGTSGYDFAYTQAHDLQFGNAILANRPLSNVYDVQLPYGDGPQRRGMVVADYMNVTFAAVHLQHKQRDQTRVDQTAALLAELPDTGPLVVAGDYNDVPGSRAVTMMLDAGFVSAQDAWGVEGPTYVGVESASRIDYIFGRGVEFTSFDLMDQVLWSDHLPLVVRLATPE